MPVDPTGIRFVLADCRDPARAGEFNAWYDEYAADCLRPGLLVAVRRYRNPDKRPEYAAVYDIVDPDPARAWPETQHHPARRFTQRNPLLDVALKATYARVEPRLPRPSGGGVAILLTDEDDPERVRGAQGMRFVLVEGEPDPPRYLELYEADRPEELSFGVPYWPL